MTQPSVPPTTDDRSSAGALRVQRIIRLALLAGVLTFGGIVWFVLRHGGVETAPLEPAFLYGFVAVLVASGVGIAVIQLRHAAETEPARLQTLALAGWALGEAPALLGGVLYLLSGNPVPYLVGLGMMLVSFVMIPVREPRSAR
jgi:hypothetical protein